MTSKLYVVVTTDDENNIVGFPKGGGSSSPSFIRAFTSAASAKRSAKRLNYAGSHNTKVAEVTSLKLIEKGDE